MKYNAILKVGVLIENNGRLLLIKERNWKNGKYQWNIIKGTHNSLKDKNLIDTVMRESLEEANAIIKIESLQNIIYLKKHNQPFIQLNFIAKLKHIKKNPINKILKPKKHDDGRSEDIIEIKFFNKTELKKMKIGELIGERAYISIQNWLNNESFPIKALKNVKNY